ncbi:LacI family transcriptional regulator [Advenella sp. S44]|uniref:Bug family tripartite tricarboxylate transporter substrate binding protein n=1 Tax=Advenella sp. S44 TaxID=1982755 RepID=UPI000C2AC29F|nr:tripartite tricarboxylate transporter substrate binding protein [Advenella sp. S44]PJX22968.1 LacI family transcriptional regulator [Advenella sp. S44]
MKHKLLKQSLLVVAIGTIAATNAMAQESGYPQRPISLIVSAAPGGTTDLAARMIADPLSKELGQPVVVENKPGASGGIAAQQVLRAKPDGYSLLLQYSGYQVITPSIEKVSWDPVKDFTPIANVLSAPQLLVVKKALPVNSLKELVQYAKDNPDKLNYASSGTGALQHVATEQLNQMAGIKTTHVPYKGTGPALTDLLAGVVDMTITTPPPLLPHVKSGALKALVVTSKEPLASLPDVPTASAAGYPDLLVSSWFAMYGPKGVPQDVVERLNAAIKKIMATPEYKKKAETLGATAEYMGPQQLGEYTAEELVRWKKVIDAAGIKGGN